VETATQALHRLTSPASGPPWDRPESPDDPRLVRDFQTNDMARFPWFFKRYGPGLPRLALPRDLPPTVKPAVSVLAGTAGVPRGALDLPQLARLLYLSAGVVRTMERPHRTWLFRAAGSAGGRFPLELYVAVPDGLPLPAGVHWYQPREHVLVRVGPPPRGGAPTVIITGIPWRTGWRYRERGYRHVYWDAGTMLAQLLALADSAGLTTALYSQFPDAAVAALVGADLTHEWPVAVVGLGDGDPALEAAGPAEAGRPALEPLEFPLVTAAQRAGDGDTLGAPWGRGAPVQVPARVSPPVEQVILMRGSQRRMDGARGVPLSLLRTAMGPAMRGVSLPHWVVVHDVAGLAPGIYRWPSLSAPVRGGALRGDLYRVCMDQALPRDAAFVVIATADLSEAGDRQYRDVHLAAGLVEGRLHLAAYALGASATGMTFIDSQVPPLLGSPGNGESLSGVLFTCVGVPAYTSAVGGPPGAPTAVRPVTSR
jgi:hypothetical protein